MNQDFINGEFKKLAIREHLLPIKTTAFYREKVHEEISALGQNVGPLHRAVYPTEERLTLRVPGEVVDFVSDRENMPSGLEGLVIHKYRDRVLFLAANTCAAHCQYCFRQNILAEGHAKPTGRGLDFDTTLAVLLKFLKHHPHIQEVILSGGDPMTLPFSRLERLVNGLKSVRIEHIRIHTRTLVFEPRLFTSKVIRLLESASVRLVLHSIHPYEMCKEVERYVAELRSAGIRLYNQFPLLRKVNDHTEVLARHLGKLDELGIRNLSIFIPDPINFSASFRIRLKRLFSLIDDLNRSTPSWINATRLVLDTPFGKVRREDFHRYDEATGTAMFLRGDREIRYQDFPCELDQPGDLKTLLWKDQAHKA